MSLTITAALVATVLQCPVCAEAREQVEEGDTAAAVERLRASVRQAREARTDPDPEAAGLLGELLVHTAESRAVEFEDRSEAQELLRLAVEKDQDNPRWWYALGLLERMRGLKADAIRYLDRALDLLEERPEALTLAEEARAWAEKGRARQEHVVDFQGFVAQNQEIPVVSGECAVAFCMNFERPDWFHEILFGFDTQEQLVEEDREKMRQAFATAFELDPSHDLAARGWLDVLARSHEWSRFLEVGRGYAEATDGDPWALTFLGAGLHRMGREAAADSAFARALEGLPEEDRELLTGVTNILRASDAEMLAQANAEKRQAVVDLTWRRLDPFYLTEANERRLEHLTRVALAELRFGDPRIHERGARTEPGIILIRYGEPEWIRQIRIDDGVAGALQEMGLGKPAAGGRFVFWIYSKNSPAFIFEKQLGSRGMQHAGASASREVEENMRSQRPSTYRPDNFRALRHQLALFKGTEADVEADVILEVPRLDGEPEGPVPATAGVFIVPGAPDQDPTGLRTSLDLARSGGSPATFRLPVNRGRYPYSAEVVGDDGSVRASARGLIEAQEFGNADFYLSDLLVAGQIRPARPDPTERRHFRIAGSPDLTFDVGSPLALYFEIYGLEEDDDMSRYEVEVRVRGEEGEGLLGGIVRRIGNVLGDADQGETVRWSGTARGEPERVPEWFTLTLPELEPGAYTVEVTVRDENGDREATAVRTVTFRAPGSSEGEGGS